VSLDKAGRGKMHKALRALYPGFESETVEETSKSGEGQRAEVACQPEGACQPLSKTIVLRRTSATSE